MSSLLSLQYGRGRPLYLHEASYERYESTSPRRPQREHRDIFFFTPRQHVAWVDIRRASLTLYIPETVEIKDASIHLVLSEKHIRIIYFTKIWVTLSSSLVSVVTL